MNQLVIDTSAIISILANEKSKPKILKIIKNYKIIASRSVHHEIGNAFSAMMKKKIFSIDQCVLAIEQYKTFPIQFIEVNISKSLHICNKENMYCYDAYILQIAQSYKVPLLSLDKKLNTIAQKYNIKTFTL